MKGYLTIIVTHDFLSYATRDYNSQVFTEDYIGNYALIYALNGHINTIQRIHSGTKPFYLEDMKKIEIYSTPALILSKFKELNENINNLVNEENHELQL